MVRSVFTRRAMLGTASSGFGLMAFKALLAQQNRRPARSGATRPVQTQQEAKVRNVIFCYMSGGVSHIDSFDPKPRLSKEHGQPFPLQMERTQFNDNGNIMSSPWKFERYGQSGLEVSELFPRVGTHADKLAVIRSMTAPFSEHAQGNFFMHSGFPFLGHPSAGAWINYGLGSEAENLPGYVVLQSGSAVPPHGGVGLFGSGFLPAEHQASIVQLDQDQVVRNIRPGVTERVQQAQLEFLAAEDRQFAETLSERQAVEAAIANYEMAYRMQAAVPELTDLRGETAATRELYGLDSDEPSLAAYARQCLLARRLVERGVRFVELSCLAYNLGGGNGPNPWDHHGQLEEGHRKMARQVDQPIAGLLQDLAARGLLDETLVIWAGEFGRTPFSQGSDGRDHNPFGFSIWLCGGGIRGATVYGGTDEYGYRAVENPCTVYDLWATVLHCLGVDHQELTFRHGGRDYRLTDVHGHVLDAVLA